MLASCVKDGKYDDAEEVLAFYLAALDEELGELHTYISAHKPTSALSAEELEGEAQSAGGQAEVGKRHYTVRRFCFSPSELNPYFPDVRMDTNRQNQSNRPSRAYSVESPDRPYARLTCLTLSPLKIGSHSNLISRFLLSRSSTRPYVLVTDLQNHRAARFSAHNSRRTCSHLAASTRAGRPVQLERGEPTGATNRGASSKSRPPS